MLRNFTAEAAARPPLRGNARGVGTRDTLVESRAVTDWSTLATERSEDGRRRCAWRYPPEYVGYHDDEWGRPVTDDTRLYEKLCLEGFQSGLSWLTVLRKREGFRKAFAGFDPVKVASYTERDVERLLTDAAIIRNRGKIEATIANARATLEVQARPGSLAELVWSFEPKRRGRKVPYASTTCPRRRRSRRRSPRSCVATGSGSSDPRRCTQRCSRSGS
jgi:DNA-3-methyladenine glycosylase I